MEEVIINKVAQSGLITFNLEEHYHPGERALIDIKDTLFMGLILKEKDFREWVKNHDWSQYEGKNVAIFCGTDAIIPTWAYMLVASKLSGNANFFVFGDEKTLETALYLNALQHVDVESFRDKRVVIKGCSDFPVPESAYVEITRLLAPVVKSIMFGEPCSTVPVLKR